MLTLAAAAPPDSYRILQREVDMCSSWKQMQELLILRWPYKYEPLHCCKQKYFHKGEKVLAVEDEQVKFGAWEVCKLKI